MEKYAVSVTEILSRLVTVEAKDEQNALDIVEDLWKDGRIILDTEDFQSDPKFEIEDKSCIEDEAINANG